MTNQERQEMEQRAVKFAAFIERQMPQADWKVLAGSFIEGWQSSNRLKGDEDISLELTDHYFLGLEPLMRLERNRLIDETRRLSPTWEQANG